MTAHRNARGQFVSADVAAAERVLEAAVREAVALIRSAHRQAKAAEKRGHLVGAMRDRADARAEAHTTLYAAGRAVEPLLRSAS